MLQRFKGYNGSAVLHADIPPPNQRLTNCNQTHKLLGLLIFRPAEGKRLSWLEHRVGYYSKIACK